jgi:hypothetical protein
MALHSITGTVVVVVPSDWHGTHTHALPAGRATRLATACDAFVLNLHTVLGGHAPATHSLAEGLAILSHIGYSVVVVVVVSLTQTQDATFWAVIAITLVNAGFRMHLVPSGHRPAAQTVDDGFSNRSQLYCVSVVVVCFVVVVGKTHLQ